jgi:release factor glutamine methyltransferase
VHAVEKSPEAFEWLNENVAKHAAQLAANGSAVVTYLGDATDESILSALNGTVAVVATNPPYIPDAMIPREPEVRDHDPHMALFGGSDGFDVARGVIAVANELLVPNGLFGMEHADVQGESVMSLLAGWIDPVDHKDYNQLPRYVTARSGRVDSL